MPGEPPQVDIIDGKPRANWTVTAFRCVTIRPGEKTEGPWLPNFALACLFAGSRMWSIGPDFENVFFDESAQAFVFTGGDDLAIHIETEQMPADYFADLPARVRTEETSGDDEI